MNANLGTPCTKIARALTAPRMIAATALVFLGLSLTACATTTQSDAGAAPVTTTSVVAPAADDTAMPTPYVEPAPVVIEAPAPVVVEETPVVEEAPAPVAKAAAPKVQQAAAPAAPAAEAPAPAPAVDNTYGCDAAMAYLRAHAEPSFQLVCGGYAFGGQAVTCYYHAPQCANSAIIIINVPCETAYKNEAANSWTLKNNTGAKIDPYGSSC
jgi:hypothetical protein